MIADALNQLAAGEHLSAAEMESVMDNMLSGALKPEEIAGFLMALRCKGETVVEITAAASDDVVDYMWAADADTGEIFAMKVLKNAGFKPEWVELVRPHCPGSTSLTVG